MPTAPLCVCLAGPNGSGKSTLAIGLANLINTQNWIDPDRLAEQRRIEAGAPHLTPELSLDAFKAARNSRVEFARKNADFGFETVYSHSSNLAFLHLLKLTGYEIHLYFICTDSPDINVSRVQTRVSLGGHRVDEDKVRARYKRSLLLLSLSATVCDRIVLLDNSNSIATSSSGGRVVADIKGDMDGQRRAEIVSYPPIKAWCLAYGLYPHSDVWVRSAIRRQALDEFGETFHPDTDLEDPFSEFEF